MKNDVVFKITTEDVQDVALREVGRELTGEEIKRLAPIFGDLFKWKDDMADVINANIKTEEDE